MRIYIPATITIKDLATDQIIMVKNQKTDEAEPVTIKFYEFLVGTLLKDQVFGKNAMTVMHAIEIKNKVEKAEENTYIDIADEGHALLIEAAKNPQIPFNPTIAIQLGPFLESILFPSKEPSENN